MAYYAVVENGVITEQYDSVPLNWRNVSGFNLMPEEDRKQFGFYPVIQSNVIFNPVRHKEISRTCKVNSDGLPYMEVILEDKMTDSEFAAYEFNESMSILRNRRNSLLSSTDWTMAIDLADVYGQTWVDNWKQYRQQLRDFTDSYKDLNVKFDAESVVFPDKPY